MEPSAETWNSDWEQVELTAEFRRVAVRLSSWADAAPRWPPYQSAKQLLDDCQPRLREMQVNLGRVLVVGVVGGTGVGKSMLVNALVGCKVCRSGDQRPTTRKPEVLCHTDADPTFLQFDGEEIELRKLDHPLLEEMILIDCPDPDTQGTDTPENRDLEILRRVLPHCDVILYVASAEKYKTYSVQQEVLRHAGSRTLIFVQNRAAVDHDVRQDWKAALEIAGFKVPPIFFLDSERALANQLENKPAAPEFEQLRQHLRFDIAHRARHRIKRANMLGLLSHLADRMGNEAEGQIGSVRQVKEQILSRRGEVFAKMQQHVAGQLERHRALWHVRLSKQLINYWGSGPFIGFFRISTGFVSIVNTLLLARARTPMQMLVVGGLQAGKALGDRIREEKEQTAWITAADLGVSEADLVEAGSIVQGYAREARLDPDSAALGRQSRYQRQADQLQAMSRQLYEHVEAALGTAVERQVVKKAGPITRAVVNAVFVAAVGYILFLLGRNFFYDTPWLGKPLMGLDFLVHAIFWIVVLALFLQWAVMRRLRRGFKREIASLIGSLPAERIIGELYGDLEDECERIEAHFLSLKAIEADIGRLKGRFGRIEDVPIGTIERF
jgi:hypothetical protein